MRDLSAIDMSDYLPHRPPFLMVDKVLDLDQESVVTALKIKSDNVFVLDNEFNEFGLVEFAAQTCSAIVGSTFFDEDDHKGSSNKLIGFISSIKKLEVYDLAPVGSTVIARARLLSNFDGDKFKISTMSCNIFVGDKELLSCELILYIQEKKNLE